MEQLFVTSIGKLREHWAEAFPRAIVARSVDDIGTANSEASGVVWLDISNTPDQRVGAEVKAAVAWGRPLVVLAATPNEAQAFHLMQNGAVAYCHVEAVAEQLREVALVVEHGGLWMPPELMQRFLRLSLRVVPNEAPSEPEFNELTSRELMVAEQVAHGASNREIAETLGITERTVKAHLSAIFEKLGVRDRVQLALGMNNIPIYTSVN